MLGGDNVEVNREGERRRRDNFKGCGTSKKDEIVDALQLGELYSKPQI